MKSKEQLVEELSAIIPFVESLREVDDEVWTAPLGEGKWSVRDILSHILLWDKYILEEALSKIVAGKPVTIRHLAFDEFNEGAIEYGKSKPRREIIDEAVDRRKGILDCLRQIPPKDYSRVYSGLDREFIVQGYARHFIIHDSSHMRQIEGFLEMQG